MSDHELIQIIEKILDEKMPQNFSYINFSFFELRVKYNLGDEDIKRLLQLARTKLENDNYKVYYTR